MTPLETIRYSGAVLHTALPLLQPIPAHVPAIAAAGRLNHALEDHCLIATREISWERFYPELADEDDPHEAALAKAAEEAGERAETLIKAMAGCGIRVDDEAVAGGAR